MPARSWRWVRLLRTVRRLARTWWGKRGLGSSPGTPTLVLDTARVPSRAGHSGGTYLGKGRDDHVFSMSAGAQGERVRGGSGGPRDVPGLGGHSQVAGDGGVAGHGLWGQVVVAVGAVEEGLAALAVGEGALQDQPRARAGLGVQCPPPGGAILQVKAVRREGTRLAMGV